MGWCLNWMIFQVSSNLDDTVILWKAWNMDENKATLNLLINGKLLRYKVADAGSNTFWDNVSQLLGLFYVCHKKLFPNSKPETRSGALYLFAAVFVGICLKGTGLRPNSSVFTFYLMHCLRTSPGENFIIISKNKILNFLHFSQSPEIQMNWDILLGAINSTRCQDM